MAWSFGTALMMSDMCIVLSLISYPLSLIGIDRLLYIIALCILWVEMPRV